MAVSRFVFVLLLMIGLLAMAPGVAARGVVEVDEEAERASQHAVDDDAPADAPADAEPERQADDAPPENGPPEPEPEEDPSDGVEPDAEIEPETDPDAVDPDPDEPEPAVDEAEPTIDVERLMLELERAPIMFDRPADARRLSVRIEADRRLLSELRKPIPTDRIEAELYLRRIRDLAAISDPVLLVPLANNVIRQAPLLFEWMATEYDDPEERARDYYVGGSWAFHRRFDAFHRAVLLTVIRRLDAVGDLLLQGEQ